VNSEPDSPEIDLPVPLAELAAAVDSIELCLTQMAAADNTLILLHMGAVERHLEVLAAVTVVTWPDVKWALYFSNARVRALDLIRRLADSPRSRRSDGLQAAALREVSDLITQRYPPNTQTGGTAK